LGNWLATPIGLNQGILFQAMKMNVKRAPSNNQKVIFLPTETIYACCSFAVSFDSEESEFVELFPEFEMLCSI